MAEFLRRGWDARVALENELHAQAERVRSDVRPGRASRPVGQSSGSGGAPRTKAASIPASIKRAAPRPLVRLARKVKKKASRGLGRVALTRRADTGGLSEDLHKMQAATERNLRASTADLIQEVQAARESLRRDLDLALDGIEKVRSTVTQLERHLGVLRSQVDRVEDTALVSARRVAVDCGDGGVMVGTAFGLIMVSPRDQAVIAGLLEGGDLERGTRLLIQRILAPGSCFVDVGANLGCHSVAAARAMQNQGQVIAVEPYPPTADLLRRSLWINGAAGTTEVHEVAAGTGGGRQVLYLGATSGHHSLYPLDNDLSDHGATYEVNVMPLDDIVRPGQHVDLLKIDVEGAELDVLASAHRVLSDNPDVAVVVEFGPSHLSRTGVTPTEWFGAFAAAGMQFRVIDADTGKLRSVTVDELMAVTSVNLLFARASSPVWSKAAG